MEITQLITHDFSYEVTVSFEEGSIIKYIFNYKFVLQEQKRIEFVKPHPYTPEFEKELFALIAKYIWDEIEDMSYSFTSSYSDVELYVLDPEDDLQNQQRKILRQIDKQNYQEISASVVRKIPGKYQVEGCINLIVKSEDLAKMIRDRHKARSIYSQDGSYELCEIKIQWEQED